MFQFYTVLINRLRTRVMDTRKRSKREIGKKRMQAMQTMQECRNVGMQAMQTM